MLVEAESVLVGAAGQPVLVEAAGQRSEPVVEAKAVGGRDEAKLSEFKCMHTIAACA